MKNAILAAITAATIGAIAPTYSSDAHATVVAEVCSATGCIPVDPVTAGIAIAVSTAANIERSCTQDRTRSCTKEAKKAGQNLVDYTRLKKNPVKALNRRLKKTFGW